MIEEVFDNYVSNYDINDEDIKLKYNHSYRVMNLSEKYAKMLNFSEYDIKLAKLIGLLHDIGRFEQLKIYGSYDDKKTIDHADYAVDILFNKGLIEEFWSNKSDYELIKFAIKYHNKFKIPNISDKRITMHAKLIRDTDKIDIIYLMGYLGELNLRSIEENVSPKIIEAIKNHSSTKYKYINNKNDSLAIYFAYAFDINYDICLKELKNNYKYYYKQIEGEKYFKQVYNIINKYIDERMNKYVRNKI